MPTLLWKVKSRIETLFHTSTLFNNLTSSLLEKLPDKDVFFVEIGANDGISADPLHSFIIKKKWSGVYVEPQKAIFEKLLKNFEGVDNLFFENIAITETESDFTLYVPKDKTITNYSGIASLTPESGVLARFDRSEIEEQTVKGKPLDYLIDKFDLKNKKILFLLIDVEGYEKTLILGMDFSKFSPNYILFEHAHMSYDTHRHINGYLAKNGYKIYIDKFDTLAYRPA
jgi:FkbM family methyltransferase